MSLLNTEILCKDLWEDDLKIQLPYMEKDKQVFLRFTVPSRGHIEGLFVVVGRLDFYDAERSGYVQRLRLEPL
jgi:hypothetical protein